MGADARRKIKRWMWVIIAVTIIGVYVNTIPNDFVGDDFIIIVDNPETHSLANIGKVLFSPDITPPYYRPLVRATFLLDYALFGPNPAMGHVVNLLLHLVAVILLFLVARIFFQDAIPALITALLWGVHPVGSEAVGLISVRTNSMAVLFMLTTLYLIWKGYTAGKQRMFWLAGLAFLAALGSKEQAVMVIPLAGLLLWHLPQMGGPRIDRKQGQVILIPLLAALVVYILARIITLGDFIGTIPYIGGSKAPMSPLDVLIATGKYFTIFIWPSALTVVHNLRAGTLAPSIAGFVAIIGVTVASLKWRTPARLFGITWFWLMLIPTLQFIALPSVAFAERHAYFMYAGLMLVFVDWARAAFAYLPSQQARIASVVTACVVITAFGVRTIVRNRDWRDNETLYTSAQNILPSSLAYFNLGNEAMKKGNMKKAAELWKAGLELDPKDADALNQLGVLEAQRGNLEEAFTYFSRALQVFPKHPVASENLNRVLHDLEKRETGDANDAGQSK